MPGLYNRGKQVFRKVKGFASNAYATAQELAPGVHKAVEAGRKGYEALDRSGLVDKYAGKHAQDVRSTARRGFDTYDTLSRQAQSLNSDYQKASAAFR